MTNNNNINKDETTKVYPEGSAEKYLYDEMIVPEEVLDAKHSMFSMRIEDGQLIFQMRDRAIRYMASENLIEGYKKEVNAKDIIEVKTGKAAGIAREFEIRSYDDDYNDEQVALMCYIAYKFYFNSFKHIKTFEDIKEPVPSFVLLDVIARTKDIEILYKDNNGFEFAGKLRKITAESSMFGVFFKIIMEIIVQCDKGYSITTTSFSIPYVQMVKGLEDLKIEKLTEEKKAELTERGRKYVKYTENPSYCQNNGFGFTPGSWGDVRVNVTGRVMLDLKGMRKLQSHIGDRWYLGNPFNLKGAELVEESKLWMCSPIVYGFSFMSKDWVKMNIETISDIQFSDKAFDELIVPEVYKDIFVASLTHEMPSFDSIEGKGNAKIFLLYGPPGTGKTMTAESVSEYLHKPLYFVSVGELGISPDSMEDKLTEVMEVAASWDAIILLDEVDVFAVKRSGADIQRNAMTAIFLRLLEKYNGIMFMTTNLKENLDPAFISRATATIPYEALESKDRQSIWKNILDKANDSKVTVSKTVFDCLNVLAEYPLNGREIKNHIRLAYTMALNSEKKEMTMDILTSIIGLRSV